MGELFTFFKNATKALFFSPFYLLFFVLILIKAILLYFFGEVMALIGFFNRKGYDQPQKYIYERRLQLCKEKNMTFDVLKELNRRQKENKEMR